MRPTREHMVCLVLFKVKFLKPTAQHTHTCTHTHVHGHKLAWAPELYGNPKSKLILGGMLADICAGTARLETMTMNKVGLNLCPCDAVPVGVTCSTPTSKLEVLLVPEGSNCLGEKGRPEGSGKGFKEGRWFQYGTM